LAPLKAALKHRPRQTTELHRLLASAYYRDRAPQLNSALEHMRQYLADRMLAPAERQAGLAEQARMLLDQGETAEAETVLARIPAQGDQAAAVAIMRARLVMLAAKKASGPEAERLWSEAIALLRNPVGRTQEQEQGEPQYLLGLCYLGSGDKRAAQAQFSRARRIGFGLPEGIAAAMEEADLARQEGHDDESLELYRQLLHDAGDLREYSNSWLPLPELERRLVDAYRHYRDGHKFAQALALARGLDPVLSSPRIVGNARIPGLLVGQRGVLSPGPGRSPNGARSAAIP
jgi:tetratricopeptide (TPR) repeat protein